MVVFLIFLSILIYITKQVVKQHLNFNQASISLLVNGNQMLFVKLYTIKQGQN